MPAGCFWQDISAAGVITESPKDETCFGSQDVLSSRELNSRQDGLRNRSRRPEHQLANNGMSTDEKSLSRGQGGGGQVSSDGGQGLAEPKGPRGIPTKPLDASEGKKNLGMVVNDQRGTEDLIKRMPADAVAQSVVKHGSMEYSINMPGRESTLRYRKPASSRGRPVPSRLTQTSLTEVAEENVNESLALEDSYDGKSLANTDLGFKEACIQGLDMAPKSEMLSRHSGSELSGVTLPSESVDLRVAPGTNVIDSKSFAAQLKSDSTGLRGDPIRNIDESATAETEVRRFDPDNESPLPSPSSGAEARNRWRRAKTKLAFVHHISEGHRRDGDFLNDGREDHTTPQYDTAGKADPTATKGVRFRKEVQGSGQSRSKGRRGQEGMVVKQDKGMIARVQDFYVACLKMPITHFLIGVFLAPIALGLLFTPIYLFDKGGLSFNGEPSADEIITGGRGARAKRNILHLMDVFLYALSLSTTFGGSPVAALSTFCLCVANVHTLMGQFLFVFLSGAVFARMSQPSQPIRCSKKAVIRVDDFTSLPSKEVQANFKVFAVRLVLTGPPPCELVDAKICLTFRILIKLPTGSMFCSTQDLTLVRPEISYLRYGILVRHVIDSSSPIYGHTMESLIDGDASFSLTIMGLERASMQQIFHLEDYFVCDGDVAWDADYIDFIHIDKAGNRVLDHSKLDMIRFTEDTKVAGSWKGKRESPLGKVEEEGTLADGDQASVTGVKAGQYTRSKSTAWRSKSTSFTRADRST